MNATKRKFNTLLNGIGTKSTSTLSAREVNNASKTESTAAPDEDSLAKKRRVSHQPAAPIAKPSSIQESNVSATAKHSKSASLANPAAATQTPKYAPWDRAEFLKRLKTFSNLTDWAPKPTRVNEVEWAKRGWVCQKFERVRCSLCSVEILVKLNRKEQDGKEVPVYIANNIEEALVDKYAELIVTSHDVNCLWRKRGCDETIFKLPLNHAPTTIQNLLERYTELSKRKETLPYMFNMRTPPGFDLDLVLSYLPGDFFTHASTALDTENTPTDINKVAFLMALFGWEGHSHERLGIQLGSASCQACFRVLGLWIFKSKAVNEAGDEVEGAAMTKLDVVKEHREYCPWKNADSQTGQTAAKSSILSMAGWEVLLRVLKNDHYLRTSGERPVSGGSMQPSLGIAGDAASSHIEEDDKSIRDAKDKERWARLRRVKSLFETKGGKKLQRPGTAKSGT